MARTSLAFIPMENYFQKYGFLVLNWNYNGFFKTTTELSEEFKNILNSYETNSDIQNIHLVGHSLGNIIIRSTVTKNKFSKIKSIVMLTPPNQGARLADIYASYLSWLLLPITDLKTGSENFIGKIPKISDIPIGIIAAKNDVLVQIEETRLTEAKEHSIFDSNHTFIMLKEKVMEMIRNFINFQTFFPSTNLPN